MSDNRASEREWLELGIREGFLKRYARGKIGLLFSGNMKHLKTAEKCFSQALEISVNLNMNVFVRAMRDHGTSEKAIHEFLNNCILVDEIHLDPPLSL